MSSTEEMETKAGHPPAVKAGGMRVTTHKKRTTSTGSDKDDKKMTEEELAEYGVEPTEDPKHKQNLVIAGAAVKGDADFKPEAVKVYHDKPLPSKEKPHNNPQHNIQQPRK